MSAAHVNANGGPPEWLPSPFRLEVEPERDIVRVCPSGEIDIGTVGTVRRQIEELVSDGFARVVLDLRGVTFADSTALHLTVELAECSRSDGWQFVIIQGPPAVQRAFEIAGLMPRLPFVEPRDVRSRLRQHA